MSADTRSGTVLSESAGAVFYRCALQVNPSHYMKSFRGDESQTDPHSYVESVLEKAADIGISVLAITDHNSVSGVSAFRAAAEKYKITIFPGFELTSSEGIHILCIYSPDTDDEQTGRFLGEFGIRDTGPSSDLANKDFADILRTVREQGGIAIAAHVTSSHGLLKELNGLSRIQAWKNENLLSIQIPGSINDLEYSHRQIVLNRNPEYARPHQVAVVNAKDITKADGLEDPSSSCWIKMSAISIEGLRQAFLDPESRIRLNSDPAIDEHMELISITWEGGFLDGITVRFNSNLNVLVGGRGAGKSTMIESLRYVLDLEPLGEDARKSHEGMLRRVLRNGTKISLRARSHRPITNEYLIERIVPNPPVVRDVNGHVSNLLPADILPELEVYGQHEISELTRNREKLTRLLDRFILRDEGLDRRKSNVRQELGITRKAILDVHTEIEYINERLAALPNLEETLSRYQEAGLEERLKDQSLLVREEQVIDSMSGRLEPFNGSLELLRNELPIDLTFLSPKALQELPGKAILSEAIGVFDRLNDELGQAAAQIEKALEHATDSLGEIRDNWGDRKTTVEEAYNRILRELKQSAVDGAEFIRLRREIEELRPQRERKDLLVLLLKEHTDRRNILVTEWEDIKAREFRLLDGAARMVGRKLKSRVQVQVNSAGDREPLAELLRAKIGGRLSESINIIRQLPELSLPVLVDSLRKGADAVQETFRIPTAQAESLARAPLEVLMQIEELDLPPTTVIHLNTASDESPPSWQELEELSTGQKATAVLLLMLLESEAPLIIDQPEDDLDNRFITEGIVPKMREEKRRRQFIFSTHNANIPVLGDAELIVGLTASGSGETDSGAAQVAPEHTGSIDALPVQELVEEILEGGRTAFEIRRRKYGF